MSEKEDPVSLLRQLYPDGVMMVEALVERGRRIEALEAELEQVKAMRRDYAQALSEARADLTRLAREHEELKRRTGS